MPPEVTDLADEARGGDRDADATDIFLEPPGAPPHRRPVRQAVKPVHYSQDQEKEAAEKARKKITKNGKTKDSDNLDLQNVVNSLCDANQALQQQVLSLYEANKALQQQVFRLASDLEKRDLERSRSEAEYQNAVSGLQSELSGIKQLISGELLAAKSACSDSREGNANANDGVLRELQSMRREITELSVAVRSQQSSNSPSQQESQAPSVGRSWASIATPSSVVSPASRVSRADLGLPMVVLDVRQATPQAKSILQDPTLLQKTIGTALRAESQTENIQIEGIKSAPRSTIKVFVSRKEDAEILTEQRQWLKALPGVKLQEGQWFPVKLDEVRKSDVYDDSGLLRGDFRDCFTQENGGAQIKKIRWLSGDKRFGSMAVYLSREVDAQNLLRRRIVHIRGEAVFAEAFLYRNRPLRCRNCHEYGHKAVRCRNETACECCAGPHASTDCTSDILRCAACEIVGHAVSDPECETWKKEWEKIRGPSSTIPGRL
jgi:hypothetical protein